MLHIYVTSIFWYFNYIIKWKINILYSLLIVFRIIHEVLLQMRFSFEVIWRMSKKLLMISDLKSPKLSVNRKYLMKELKPESEIINSGQHRIKSNLRGKSLKVFYCIFKQLKIFWLTNNRMSCVNVASQELCTI